MGGENDPRRRYGLGLCRVVCIEKWYLSPPEPAVHGKARMILLLLFLLARRSGGSASVHAPVNVLLFFLGWFQDLRRFQSDIAPRKWKIGQNSPGMNRVDFRPHSS